MPVPDYQTLMLPLLRRLAEQRQPVPLRSLVESVAEEFALTEAERAERIPSGQENLLFNRLAWARTYLGKAGLLTAPKRGQLLITDEGKKLLDRKPASIDNATLRNYPTFLEWLTGSRGPSAVTPRRVEAEGQAAALHQTASRATPHERIAEALGEIQAALRSDLIERVRRMAPADFEELILRLLLSMGYGQGLDELASALGGSGDGGMDGVIHQDPLGLDRVYIQAKRYRDGNNVSSPDIRNFVGALNIHRATKGVFVTASQFTNDARSAAQGSTIQVVLIDGERLTELMVRYKVGVLTRDLLELKELDEGFFDH